MTNEYGKFLKKIQENPLYQKSASVHKKYQFTLFRETDGELVNGQRLRREDKNGRSEGEDGYDESSARLVKYNFEDGVISSKDDEPAVEWPGHWEFWKKGIILKVVADGGDTEEYWKDGVPVRIETDLKLKRMEEAADGRAE